MASTVSGLDAIAINGILTTTNGNVLKMFGDINDDGNMVYVGTPDYLRIGAERIGWAEKRGFKIELNEASEGDEAGIKSVTFTIHGDNAYGLISTERGVHRLVRISPFDSAARRHTSCGSGSTRSIATRSRRTP